MLVTLVVTKHVPPAPRYFEEQKSTRFVAVLLVPGLAYAEQVSNSSHSSKRLGNSAHCVWRHGIPSQHRRMRPCYLETVAPSAWYLP